MILAYQRVKPLNMKCRENLLVLIYSSSKVNSAALLPHLILCCMVAHRLCPGSGECVLCWDHRAPVELSYKKKKKVSTPQLIEYYIKLMLHERLDKKTKYHSLT